MPAMSKAVFSGVLKRSCRLLLVTVIFTPEVTAQLDFASKNKRKNSIALTVMNLMRRFVHASNERAKRFRLSGRRTGALSNQPAPANNAPISTPPANQNNRQQQASTTSNSGPRSTQRNETSNYEVDRTIRHTKMNVGDVQRLSVAVVVNYKTLPDGKPLPLSNEQMKQIEDLTREAMGFSENAVTRSMSLTRRSIAVTKAAENCHSGNSKRLSISYLLPVAGCWYCWWRGCCGGKRYVRS